MTEQELEQKVIAASTRSIMLFLERADTQLFPKDLPEAVLLSDNNIHFKEIPRLNNNEPLPQDVPSPNGWRLERSAENLTDGFTWFSIGTFRGPDPETGIGTQVGKWSSPICIRIGRDGLDGKPGDPGEDGDDGINGVDGTSIEYIFKLFDADTDFDTYVNQYGAPESNPDKTDYVPNGWEDHPQGIDEEHRIEAMCYRKLNADTKKWGNFYGPYRWSVWGSNGKDGDGVEYIFRLTEKSEVDENSYLKREFWPQTTIEEIEAIEDEYQQEDYYPEEKGWSDDPKEVNATKCYQFVSKRKYKGEIGIGGVWQPFSEPSLWNKYALTDVSGFTAFAFTRSYSPEVGNYIMSGGNVSHPYPNKTTYNGEIINLEWHDTVPAGTAPVWMTTRFFASDNSLESSWSPATCMKDTSSFQSEWSNDFPWEQYLLDPEQYKLPNLNDYIDESDPEKVNEKQWRLDCADLNLGHWYDSEADPEDPDDDVLVDAKYMAIATYNNTSWDDWQVFKVAGESGITYRPFTIYIAFDNPTNVPSTPVGGTWDIEHDTLVGGPLNDGWSLECPASEEDLYIWFSEATFKSTDGTISLNWTIPHRYEALNIVVSSDITYYKASDKNDKTNGREVAPSESVDPENETDRWWQTHESQYYEPLSSEKPYLWSFRRVIYSSGLIVQSEPQIIRMLHDTISDEMIEGIAREIELDATEDIADLQNRLAKIVDTDGEIVFEKDKGLFQVLLNYVDPDDNTKGFADIMADAAKRTISENVGSTLTDGIIGVSHDLDGLKGILSNSVLKFSGLDENWTVKYAIQKVTADAILQSVSDGKYMWVGYKTNDSDSEKSGEMETYIPTYYKETDTEVIEGRKTILDIKDPEEYPDLKPAITDKTGYWKREYIVSQMSAIKQEANRILQYVTDEQGNVSAYLQLLHNNEEGGIITLNSDYIKLQGQVIVDAIKGNLNIDQGHIFLTGNNGHLTDISPDGLISNCAIIQGQLYTDEGFFGTIAKKYDELPITLENLSNDGERTNFIYNGIFINAGGLISSNYDNTTGFELNGDTGVLTARNVNLTGEINAESGTIIGRLTIGSDGDIYSTASYEFNGVEMDGWSRFYHEGLLCFASDPRGHDSTAWLTGSGLLVRDEANRNNAVIRGGTVSIYSSGKSYSPLWVENTEQSTWKEVKFIPASDYPTNNPDSNTLYLLY